jgi:hypothetical protein
MNLSPTALLDEILFSLDRDPYAIAHGCGSTELLDRYRALIREGKLTENIRIWKILRKRAIRSLSGVSVISLLTKFW